MTFHEFQSEGAYGRASNVSKGWAGYRGGDDRRYDVVGPDGSTHRLTEAGFRTWVAVKPFVTAAGIPDGKSFTTVTALAIVVGVSKATVSRWLQRLMSWGWLGLLTTRGHYGGVLIFGRTLADGLDHFARKAKDTIRRQIQKRRARAWAHMMVARESNVSPNTITIEDGERNGERLRHYLALYGETLESKRSWEAENERLSEALGLDPSRSQGRAACPAHGEHRNKTLSWKLQGGRLLLHCFAGCTYKEIVARSTVRPA